MVWSMNDSAIAFWALFLLVGLPVVAAVVFLVGRWFWLWYWRVNEQLEVLKDIKGSLQRLEQRSAAPAAP
jgi:hypothetical protein